MAPALQPTDPTTHQAAQSHPNQVVVPIDDDTQEYHATAVGDDDTDAGDDHSAVMRKLMKGKDKEWDAVASSRSGKKLTLLELPVDILRLIIKEASSLRIVRTRLFLADSCAARSPIRMTSPPSL